MRGQEAPMRAKSGEERSSQIPLVRRNLNKRLLIGIPILLFIVIGASILIIRHTGGENTKSISTSPATRVVTPTPTFTPTATATPTQALFSDNFTNNSLGWDTSSDSGYTRAVSNSMLTLADTKHGTTLTESLPTNDSYQDFTLTTTFTLVQGNQNDSAGIYVRGDSNLDHDYRIEINGNNTIDVVKEYLDEDAVPQTVRLMEPKKIASLHPLGQQNTLKLVLKGPQIDVIVNNTLVGSVSDTDYTKGQIDLFVHNGHTSPGVKATFKNVEVDRLPQ